MRYRVLFLLVLSLLMTVSCEKVIDIDLSDIEPQVVAMADVSAGDSLRVRMTYSRCFLSNYRFNEVADATFSIKVNGADKVVSQYKYKDKYVLDYLPQENDRLEITINVPSKGSFKAQTVVPNSAAVSNIYVTSDRSADSQEDQYALHFTLSDEPNRENYYLLSVRRIDTIYSTYVDYRTGDTIRDTSARNIRASFDCMDYAIISNDEFDLDIGTGISYANELLFSDKLFEGATHEIVLYTNKKVYYDESYRQRDSVSRVHYFIEMTTLSRDRYMYLKSLDAYMDDELLSYFTEPAQIHTNIDGCIGIFAALNKKSYEVVVE